MKKIVLIPIFALYVLSSSSAWSVESCSALLPMTSKDIPFKLSQLGLSMSLLMVLEEHQSVLTSTAPLNQDQTHQLYFALETLHEEILMQPLLVNKLEELGKSTPASLVASIGSKSSKPEYAGRFKQAVYDAIIEFLALQRTEDTDSKPISKKIRQTFFKISE